MRRVCVMLMVLALAAPAWAQQGIPGFRVSRQFQLERLGENHWRATGEVEMEQGDMRFSADIADYYTDTGLLVASGNVVFVSGKSRIAADKVEFNTKTRTGIFYTAWGTTSLGDRVEKSMFGTQEPDAYFYGEKVEKLGPRKYRITKGAFTTCVQPEPRWEIVSSSATVTLEKYAILRNSVLRVKGVPLFYLPIFYYPVQSDDRATGFLIPAYGSSTVRGQSISNAFFWAVNRSVDATVFHDLFLRSGQGAGGEFRYVASAASQGQVRAYWLNEKEASYVNNGVTVNTPARRSYEIRAVASQALPARLRARANVDYFSDITTQQTYQGNLYDATRGQRVIGGNVAGSWGANSLNATFNRTEYFYGDLNSSVYGATPRVSFSRAPRTLGPVPVYWSGGGEFTRQTRLDRAGDIEVDSGLDRLALGGQLRFPFTKLPYFTVNSSLAYSLTRYSESLVAGVQTEEPLWRKYFDVRASAVGPVFTRIFDTPNNGYASKFKHVIEPNVSFQRISFIENFDQIVKLDSFDTIYGGSSTWQYGLTNRVLAKRTSNNQARELLNVSVSQTYYADPRASQFDASYSSSYLIRPPSNYSPVLVNTVVSPTEQVSANLRLEYDHEVDEISSLRLAGSYGWKDAALITSGWSQRRVTETRKDNYWNAGGTFRLLNGRVGGAFAFDYDFARDYLMQQRYVGYYHAQCCGFTVEFQRYNFALFDPRFPVPSDTRFNVSVTLAGVGTFSNLLGAFTGQGSSRSY